MNRTVWGLAFWSALLAGVVSFAVGAHEWSYNNAHRYAPGVSGYVAALGVAGVALSFGVCALLVVAYNGRDQIDDTDRRFRTIEQGLASLAQAHEDLEIAARQNDDIRALHDVLVEMQDEDE